jgi:hypothetical protein
VAKKATHLRRLATERTRRCRRRIALGLACPEQIEISALGLDWLVATGFLQDKDAGDRVAVGRAITLMIELSSSEWRRELDRRGGSCLP